MENQSSEELIGKIFRLNRKFLHFRNSWLYYKYIDPNVPKVVSVNGDIWECQTFKSYDVVPALQQVSNLGHIHWKLPDFSSPTLSYKILLNDEVYMSDFNQRETDIIAEMKDYWKWCIKLPDTKRFINTQIPMGQHQESCGKKRLMNVL